ncbi:hypothetical protein LguiA_027430 [Lonicera macranthoides]
MPQRVPVNEEPTLRRSSRLLQKTQITAQEEDTSKNPKTQTRSNRAPFSESPSSSTRKVSLKNTLEHHPQEFPQKLGSSLRRSTRFSEKRNTQKKSEQEIKCNGSIQCTSIKFPTKKGFEVELEKRVTRNSSRGKRGKNAEQLGIANCNESFERGSTEFSGKRGSSSEPNAQSGVKLSKQCRVKLQKKMKKNTDKPGQRNGSSKVNLDKGVLSNEGRIHLGVNLSEEFTRKLRKRTTHGAGTSSTDIEGGAEREGADIHRGNNKHIGVKRKINQVEEGHGTVHGWTADQEMALQRAYLGTKPTPHFWKKVARLVPGKSAQDCFDKVHSDHLTPPQLQPRTRARTNSLSSLSFSLSASDLLNSPVLNIKKKQKTHLSHKAVRQLLQKSYQFDQDYEADLFSVLEPTLNPPVVLSTPEQKKKNPELLLKKCQQRSSSSSAHKKQVSRFSRVGLVSPPVLKQVKNKVLHDKYIDQLRSREAKRKAASARATKCSKKEDRKVGYNTEKIDAIKAAKNALVFDARDAINQFQHLQANALTSSFSDEDEDEDRG